MTIVIYDIAGENCVVQERMNVISPFVKNSDGIIMLLDPEQVKEWEFPDRGEQNKAAGEYNPQSVVKTMAGAWALDEGNSTDVPIAVTISKSDLLKKARFESTSLTDADSNIFKNVRYTAKAFMYDDFSSINNEVRALIERYCPALFTAINNVFADSGYFAVSALGHDTENTTDDSGKEIRIMRMNIEHTRLEQPLLWLMYKWGIIRSYRHFEEALTDVFHRLFRRK